MRRYWDTNVEDPRGATRGTWPNGARIAAYVAVGLEEYRLGDGRVEDILEGSPSSLLTNTAWRDYGNRVGAYRLVRGLTDLGIPPTVMLNTMLYDTAPNVITTTVQAGAEIVAHGVSNSDSLAGRSPAEEQSYLQHVREVIHDREGAPPRGWASPWLEHTENTLDLLAQVGYDYVLDLRFDDRITRLQNGLLAVPYAAELNDSSTMIGRRASARQFADMIRDEATTLVSASEAGENGIVMSIVLHSFISGSPFRLAPVLAALGELGASGDIWFATAGQIVDHYLQETGS